MICLSGRLPIYQAGKRLLASSLFPWRLGASIISRRVAPLAQSSSRAPIRSCIAPTVYAGIVSFVNSTKLLRDFLRDNNSRAAEDRISCFAVEFELTVGEGSEVVIAQFLDVSVLNRS